MATYKILLADSILAAGQQNPEMRLQFPEGCSLASQLEAGTAGTHWHSFADPGAPDEFEGREVSLRLGRDDDGKPFIRERRLILTHLVPEDDEGAFPCCGLPPFELPRGDRVSRDTEMVTCGGAPCPG